VASDMRGWDVFKDPLWLLHNLERKYKIIRIPTNGGWAADHSGGGGYQRPQYIQVYTSTDPNTRGLFFLTTFGLNSGDRSQHACDYSKRLELYFTIARMYSDPEAVARVQLKQTTSEGPLSDVGLGIEIRDFDVYGEAYGTARQTVKIFTLKHERVARVRIVHVPNNRVEFWVNGVKRGELTGTAVPTGVTTTTRFVVSIVNGPTGGVACEFYVSDIIIVQER